MMKEVEEFATCGNVVDMAIGIVMGVASGKSPPRPSTT